MNDIAGSKEDYRMGKGRVEDITLCDLLGLEMNLESGLCKVGRIAEEDARAIHAESSAHPFDGDHCSVKAKPDPFHPGRPAQRNGHFFDFGFVEPENSSELLVPSLLSLLPGLADIPDLRITYLKCDYLALHDDMGMRGYEHPYSMAILLSAPYGCCLVTGGSTTTILEPGDVVVINDQLKHGAYPLTQPESTAERNLEVIPARDRKAFVERNCLSFLLVCAGI